MMDYKKYYLEQAGGSYDVFRGAPIQRGYGLGGIFKSLYRFILPLFKTHALPALKKGAEIVGSEAVRAVSNIAQDAIKGENIEQSFKQHASSAIDNVSDQVQKKIQSGGAEKKKYIKRKVHFEKGIRKKNPKIRRIEDIFDQNEILK